MEGLLGLDCPEATCPHCGHVNTLTDLGDAPAYNCERCGKNLQL
jgi:DNA-directed RNA polymerase subunit RPC12/RpoP